MQPTLLNVPHLWTGSGNLRSLLSSGGRLIMVCFAYSLWHNFNTNLKVVTYCQCLQHSLRHPVPCHGCWQAYRCELVTKTLDYSTTCRMIISLIEPGGIRKVTRCLIMSEIIWNRLGQTARQPDSPDTLDVWSRTSWCAAFWSDRSGSLIPSGIVLTKHPATLRQSRHSDWLTDQCYSTKASVE